MKLNLLNSAKKHNKEIILFVFIVFISLSQGLDAAFVSDFRAYNGDFQNYNMIRRILDGQIPYVDFASYLGLGIVLLNAPLVALNNTFTMSILVTNFTSSLLFYTVAVVFFYLIIKNKDLAFFTTLMYIITVPFLKMYAGYFQFTALSGPGTSMRMARSFWPVLLILILLIVLRRNKDKINSFKNIKFLIISGIVLGFGAVWSNDFGFSCMISAFLLVGYLQLFVYKNKFILAFKNMFIFGINIVLGMIASITIVTAGNPLEYIIDTLGVSSYQFWYYGSSGKSVYYTDFFVNWLYNINLIICAILLVYLIYKTVKKKPEFNIILILFVFTSNIIASLVYFFGSGSILDESIPYMVFLISCALVIEKLAQKTDYKSTLTLKKCNKILLCVFICFGTVSLASNVYAYNFDERDVPYVSELGGYNEHAQEIYALSEIIGEEQVFSTYASALEVVLGTYQPSGYDYGIHVLGDEARQEYIDDFLENDYQYATTLTNGYTFYEAWIKRTNWFWYKHLLEWYEPVQATNYNLLWEKQEQSKAIDAQIELEVNKISDNTWEIIATGDVDDYTIVDVQIAYDSEFVFNLYRLNAFAKLVRVTDEGMPVESGKGYKNYLLDEKSDGTSVPITIMNNTGSIMLESYPLECTKLNVNDVQVLKVLKVS